MRRKTKGGRPRPQSILSARQAAAGKIAPGYKMPGSQNKRKSYPR